MTFERRLKNQVGLERAHKSEYRQDRLKERYTNVFHSRSHQDKGGA